MYQRRNICRLLHNSQHKLQAVVIVDMSFINDGRVGGGAHSRVLFNQAWIKFSQNSSSSKMGLVVARLLFNSHNSRLMLKLETCECVIVYVVEGAPPKKQV